MCCAVTKVVSVVPVIETGTRATGPPEEEDEPVEVEDDEEDADDDEEEEDEDDDEAPGEEQAKTMAPAVGRSRAPVASTRRREDRRSSMR
jgi:hypothetical protein